MMLINVRFIFINKKYYIHTYIICKTNNDFKNVINIKVE